MKKKTLAVLASAVIAAVFATSVEAKTILRMATDVSRDNSQAVGAEHFAKLVAEKTNGDVQIKFYPDGTLGSSQAIVSGTRTGNIDIAMIGTVNLGGLAEGFLALDLPFIFKDSAHVYRALDGKAGAELFSELDKVGLTGLAFFENGFRNITNSRKPIKVPEDVKGLKIRVPQSQTLVKTFEALGANPVPMAYGELYTAMETGAIDSQDHPTSTLYAGKFYEVQKYLSMTHHGYAAVTLVMNSRKFDKLSPEYQQIFLDCAKEAAQFQRNLNYTEDQKLLAEMQKAGLEINEDVDLDQFVEATKAVRDEFVKEHGDTVVKLIEADRNVQ